MTIKRLSPKDKRHNRFSRAFLVPAAAATKTWGEEVSESGGGVSKNVEAMPMLKLVAYIVPILVLPLTCDKSGYRIYLRTFGGCPAEEGLCFESRNRSTQMIQEPIRGKFNMHES